jgi:uncharacterized protein YndB with AHSA1/START domain
MSESSENETRTGDRAKASVTVKVGIDEAFRLFTEEIDQWWRRGLRYRVAGLRRGFLCIEPQVGGRLFESFEDELGDTRVIETGRVRIWEPPRRVVLEWRNANFAPDERTEVEVRFEPAASGTLVSVTHRGWSRLRPDHPARHDLDPPAFVRATGLWWGELLSALRTHTASGTTERESV